jgi:uncharacterized RDD family membrane protein YckC
MKARRFQAGVLDWAVLVLWGCAVVAATAYLTQIELIPEAYRLMAYGIAVLVFLIPAVLLQTLKEAGKRHATWGKQLFKLQVAPVSGRRVGFGRALARNFFKLVLPTIFAVLAVAVTLGPLTLDAWMAIAVALIFPVLYLLGLFIGPGRTLYDLASDTRVVPALGRRAIIPDDGYNFDGPDDDDEGEETVIIPRRALLPPELQPRD